MSDSEIEPLSPGDIYCSDELPVGSIQDKSSGSPIIITSSYPEETHICPCEQNGGCRHQCCAEYQQQNRKRSSPLGWSGGNNNSGSFGPLKSTDLSSQMDTLGSAGSSYGSFNENGNFNMKCPVNGQGQPTEEDGSSQSSNQPLMHGNSDLVRSGEMNG